MCFDLAVNSGPGRAVKFLQAAVGATEDGAFGPMTKARVARVHPDNIIRAMSEKRDCVLSRPPDVQDVTARAGCSG